MRIDRIHIDGFGKLRGIDLSLSQGLNIIYGRNEAGKSTLHAFLMAMLFGMRDRSQRSLEEDPYERYRNWDTPEIYGGELYFTHKGKDYRLKRDFALSREDLHIHGSDGTEIRDPQGLLDSALLSLSASAYRNTASIGQLKSAAGRDMVKELRRCIENLNTTGNLELSSNGAVRFLQEKKEKKARLYDKDAVKSYASVMGRIKNLETELSDPENANLLADFRELRDGVSSELSEAEQSLSEARRQRENSRSVLSENGFTDKRSIDDREEKLKKEHDQYTACRNRALGKLLPVISITALCMAIALGAMAFLVTGLTDGQFIVSLSASGALILISIVLGAIRHGRKKRLSDAAGILSADLEKELGSADIREDVLSDLHERFEGFRRIYEAELNAAQEEKDLSDRIIELSRKQSGYQEDISRQQDINRKVEEKLLLLNSLRNKALELRLVIAENKRIKEDMDALDIAMENLSELSREVQNSIGAYINREAGRILSGVTNGTYSRLDVTDTLDIHVNTREKSIALKNLSMGTMDQVYLALRFAAVKMIEGEHEGSLPVLFDDSFTLYDDDRLKGAMSFISDQHKGQLFIFTCQHREQEALDELGRPYRLIELG